MSFFTGNKYCDKCGKPLGIFDGGLCAECDKALEQDATKQREKELAEEWKCGYEMGFEEAKVFYEEEPCEDAISRNDMLDAVGHGTTYTSLEVQKIINGLPSVNPVPYDDEITLKVKRGALKSRQGDMVIYNVAWLREHWQMEMDIVCGVKPCDDAVSRQAVLDVVEREPYKGDALSEIEKLPSVRPQEQTGHWKFFCQHWRKCSECGYTHKFAEGWDYCPSCGARMESEE